MSIRIGMPNRTCPFCEPIHDYKTEDNRTENLLFFEKCVFDCLHPLRRVGDFKGRSIFLIVIVQKIYFNKRLMQVDAFVSPVVINSRNAGCRDLQFNFFNPAAVKQSIREQQQKSAAFAGLARFSGSSEKVHPETHGENRPAAEARFNPFAVTPAHPGDIADDPEKSERNKNPLLFT